MTQLVAVARRAPQKASGGFVFNADDASQLVTFWLKGLKADSVRSYLRSLAEFCVFAGWEVPDLARKFKELDAPAGNTLYLGWAKAMLDAEKASNTIKTRLTAIRSFVSLCRQVGLITWRIEAKDGVQRELFRDTRGPGDGGFRTIIGAIDSDRSRAAIRDRAVIRLLFDVALRRNEVRMIDVQDLDLDNAGGARVAVLQKKKRGKAWVSLPRPTVGAIREWLAVRRATEGPLFVGLDRNAQGKRMDGASIWRIVAKRAKKVGIKTSPHGFRHAAITAALDAGWDVREVRKFSRHASIEMVVRYDDNRRDTQGAVASDVATGRAAASPPASTPRPRRTR